MKPPKPANAICASEIWPRIRSPRRATAQHDHDEALDEPEPEGAAEREQRWCLRRGRAAESTTCFGRPATGIARSISVPLHGIDRPNTTSATMIARKGKPSCRPLVGNQSYCKTSFVIRTGACRSRAGHHRRRERGHATEEGGAERGDDEERERRRVEAGDRCDEDPREAGGAVATIQLIAPSRVDE